MLEERLAQGLSGGLRLKAHKVMSTSTPIARHFLPRELMIPMAQQTGAPAVPIVAVGQRVRKGEMIGRAQGPLSAATHASSSGVVTAIDEHLEPAVGRLASSICVTIETDGRDERAPPRRDRWPDDHARRLQAIRDAGIVGLGGAVFPTAEKLKAESPCELLILNGAECEPYISCDDMLMREHPAEVLRGALAMMEVLGAALTVVVIERDKPRAIEAISTAADAMGDQRIHLAEVPTIYPAGGERQLVEVLTGIEVPSGRYPIDVGCVCQNVGTAYALDRFIQLGEPLISRIVTVTGRGVSRPQNVEVPIGAPIPELIELCGGYHGDVARLILGGSMMGYALHTDELPITKASNCLVAARSEEVRETVAQWPCIRCGDCLPACPARLLPHELLRMSKLAHFEALGDLGLSDCIECGCCDVVCPSQIPLTQTFREAKRARALHAQHAELADASQQRHELRVQRLLKQQTETEQLRTRLRSELEQDGRGMIEAAVARAKRRRGDNEPA